MIRWEPNDKTKQTKEKLKECHVQHSGIDETKYTDYLYSPGQVLCFTSPGPGINHAIVKCCDYNFKKGSVFSTLWKQEYITSSKGKRKPFIYHKDIEAIIRVVLMIPTNELHDTYHQIWDCDLWGNKFCLY